MVTRRIRSEYMKKFKDPKWETYTKCYEEMLKYRLTRRLLEQTHNPWFWNGSDTDSDTGGRSPQPPGKNQVRAELEECEGPRVDTTTGTVPRLPLPDEVEDVNASAVNGKNELYMIKRLYKVSGCMHAAVLDHMMFFTQVHSSKVPERREYQRRRERSREPAAETGNS